MRSCTDGAHRTAPPAEATYCTTVPRSSGMPDAVAALHERAEHHAQHADTGSDERAGGDVAGAAAMWSTTTTITPREPERDSEPLPRPQPLAEQRRTR